METITRERENQLRHTLQRIEALISEYEAAEIVLGLPLHMDDSSSQVSEKVMAFKDQLEKRTGLPVHLWNEQLTTREAAEILKESGVKPEDRKTYIDKIAASFILEDFMTARKEGKV